MKNYTVGAMVMCDFAFGGKPRGKVVRVITPGTGQDTNGRVEVKLTETQGAYKKGETLEVKTCYAVPPEQMRRAGYGFRINTQYQFVQP